MAEIGSAEPKVGAVVVTYHPEPSQLRPLLETLAAQCHQIVVVDNGSAPGNLQPAYDLKRINPAVTVLEIGENLGIATAQNRGVELLIESDCQYLLLSDQDSAPAPGMVQILSRALHADDRVAAVGPLVRDEREDGASDELAYVARKWGPRRATPEELAQPQLEVSFLVASGCLLKKAAWQQVGAMNEALFIDHVDLEWGLRARKHGWKLQVVPAAILDHELGQNTVKIPGRTQPVHVHAPIRAYYLTRNTLWLVLRSGLLSPAWRLGYLIWLAKFSGFNMLLVPPRLARAKMIACGFWHGLLGRTGRI